MMQTPLDVPLVQFGRQVRRPRRWYHCCSGEHAAIVRGCREKVGPVLAMRCRRIHFSRIYQDAVYFELQIGSQNVWRETVVVFLQCRIQ